MRVTILAVGRVKGALEAPVSEFQERCGRYWKLRIEEVDAGLRGATPDPAAVLETEGDRLLGRLPSDAHVIALTRQGRKWGSTHLARHLEALAVSARRDVVFVVGGAFGLSNRLLDRAELRLSLSAFTLPHDLARLVLLEQLYRAGTIRRGEPYHKGE